MNILVVSKYAVVPKRGANPRWFELARLMKSQHLTVRIITSDSNHGSSTEHVKRRLKTVTFEGVIFDIIGTIPYRRSASIARVVSWFEFDLKLFFYFRKLQPDAVVISSLSLTSIVFGIYLKLMHRSRLIFEVRDIWPLTMI